MKNYDEKKSILIVDDDMLSINFLVEILKDEYTLYVAKDPETAIHMAVQNVPTLIMLDIIMPSIDGFQVLSYLRSLTETTNIPIVFMSSLSSPHHEIMGLELQANDYIKKPFNENLVKLRISNQIAIFEQSQKISKLQEESKNIRDNFYNNLDSEIFEATTSKSNLSLILVDIDNILHSDEAIRETLLSHASQTIRKSIKRQRDQISVLSSGEFAILLPNTDSQGAKNVANRLKQYFKENPLKIENETLKISLSIGITENMQKREEFIKTAFFALNKAKNNGNGNICIYEK